MTESKIYYQDNQWWIVSDGQSSLLDAAYTDSLHTQVEYPVKKVSSSEIELENGAVLFKEKSKAPYNFIRLPEKIVTVKKEKNFDRYIDNCGWFDIEFEAETDLFIRGNEEFFYQSMGKYAIPGSTLRGMLRNIAEIVSYSQLNFLEEKEQYYYRDVVDKWYLSQIVKDNQILPIPAYIKYQNGKYIIAEANKIGPYRYLRVKNSKEFDFHGDIPVHKSLFFNLSDIQNNLITRYSLENKHNNYDTEATLVMTGKFGNTNEERKFWVIGLPDSRNPIFLKTYQVKNLLEDKKYNFLSNRFPNENKDQPTWTPCFYLKGYNNEIVSISHTPFMRLRYNKNVGDHNPKYNFSATETDIAQSIFGSTTMDVAGKLMVEDAYITNEVIPNKTIIPNIQSSPKPTSYQHYLESDGITTNNYNSDAAIRGFKLYHHKIKEQYGENNFSVNQKDANIILTEEQVKQYITSGFFKQNGDKLFFENNESTINQIKEYIFKSNQIQSKPIKSLPAKTKFQGKIRFNNLTDIELGALLFIFNLPEPLRLKLGTGKSLGMGTVKLSAQTHIENMVNRYAHIKENKPGFASFELRTLSAEEVRNKIQIFENHLSSQGIKIPLWTNNNRIQDLYTMLYFDKDLQSTREWNENTNQMPLGTFNKKNPLPKPYFLKKKFKINDNK